MREPFRKPSCALLPTLTACLAAAVLLPACHARGDAGRSSTATALDPCTLVTRADAERVLGTRVKPAVRGQTYMPPGRECDYVAAPPASVGGALGIDLSVYQDTTIRNPDSMFRSAADYFRRNMAANRASGTKLVPVPDFGDAAYWQPGTYQLHVLDHGVYFVLNVSADLHIPPGPSDEVDQKVDVARRAAAIALARDTILPRLAHPSSQSTIKPPAGGSGDHSS